MTRALVCAVTLGLASFVSAGATPTPTLEANYLNDQRDPRYAPPISDEPALENTFRVGPTLYRGAQPDARGFVALERLGVKTVVNLRGFNTDLDELKEANSKLAYVHVSFKPWHAELEDVIAFLDVVAQPENHPVFVHCQHGSDRTGTMVAIYRMVFEGWTKLDAITEMTQGGYGFHRIWRNLPKFLEQLDIESLRHRYDTTKGPQGARPSTLQ